ncbi:DUF4255 domain-containing protein [Cellulomonas aerilata]|uniref:Pvc16 N-terminal domain-containing protein n=1 Tax=Cellulomonas aerilata TaxID=515326 RepID=A0A512DA00_9CELL|nr:DUF4255 domain-containing protein [Cellulomonas aerilata]GEO33296.1 hypothetical protein CAE01nite_10210 [Cellulomonas aerilata]
MIAQVDAALRSIVRSEAVPGADVEVVFDAPTKDWAARRNTPTVNLYLYDIREDLRRRERGWAEHRTDGVVTSRTPAPRYFKLSYLVTAWTQRPEDEHLLLDSLLRSFLRYEALPEPLVVGPLAATGLSVPVTVGLPPPEDRAFADVWSALGGELKPSLDVVVVTPVDTGIVYPVGPPVTQGPSVAMRDLVRGSSDAPRRVHRPAPARPGADVVAEALATAASAAEAAPDDTPPPGRTPRTRGRGRPG